MIPIIVAVTQIVMKAATHPLQLGGVLEGASGQDSKTDDDIRYAKVDGNMKMFIFHVFYTYF